MNDHTDAVQRPTAAPLVSGTYQLATHEASLPLPPTARKGMPSIIGCGRPASAGVERVPADRASNTTPNSA